jgi:hypothetical protein
MPLLLHAHSDPGPNYSDQDLGNIVLHQYTLQPLEESQCLNPGHEYKRFRPYVRRGNAQPAPPSVIDSHRSTASRGRSNKPHAEEQSPNCGATLLKILKTPLKFIKWGLRKWLSPSEDCMRCVNVTYWVVLIIGGILSAVVALI